MQQQESDLLEALDGHPQIGNVATLKEKYRNTADSAAHEQSGANEADDEVLEALAQGNQAILISLALSLLSLPQAKALSKCSTYY